jgi:murein DD-endopeptidase MepM/ murein hydrolase activator NlpD
LVGRAVRFVSRLLAVLILLPAGVEAAAAEDFRTPAISVVRVDWRAALDQLRSETGTAPTVAANVTFSRTRRVPRFDPRSMPALVQLNGVTSPIFIGIPRSPIPVLLPFDTAAYLTTYLDAAPAGLSPSPYHAGFHTDFFDAGPAGYDAVFSLAPDSGTGLPQRTFARPVEVQITGSLLTYDVADPAGGKGEPVKSLAAQYPDLRRFIREGYVRYAFTRFGVPYVVSIQCLDSAPRLRRLACREAYPVAERFLKALHVAGGLPSRQRTDIAPMIAERPLAPSPDFTYRPTGDIIANSGARRQAGRADLTAYSQIRFPLQAPAFIHSQSFGKRHPSDKSDQPSGLYPWRDNFCEARSFSVGQCASGFGHQGEDIRPGACPPQKQAANACDVKQQPILAVRDGIVIRSSKQQAATLQINTYNEHIRFRYMHMNPSTMDADAVLNGRHLAEGEKIGVVSNYLDHPNGTSRHLHFDVQVFTRDGWIWVNPYVTLISAYERLIRSRGHEIGPEIAGPPDAAAHAAPEEPVHPDPQEGNDNGAN